VQAARGTALSHTRRDTREHRYTSVACGGVAVLHERSLCLSLNSQLSNDLFKLLKKNIKKY